MFASKSNSASRLARRFGLRAKTAWACSSRRAQIGAAQRTGSLHCGIPPPEGGFFGVS